MTKQKTQNLISAAWSKNPSMWNCLFELSVFRGRLTLDEFEQSEGLVRTKSQEGIGNIKVCGMRYKGSLN